MPLPNTPPEGQEAVTVSFPQPPLPPVWMGTPLNTLCGRHHAGYVRAESASSCFASDTSSFPKDTSFFP